jgi:hypothetical protein
VAGTIFAQLSNLGNAASFQNIFDSWRILQMTVRFIPQTVQAAGALYPPLLTVIDYDDSSTITVGLAQQYDTLQESSYGTFQERTCSPKMALPAYNGTSYSNASSVSLWCDTANPNTPWYGVKYVISATPVAVAAWTIETEYVIQFRAVR